VDRGSSRIPIQGHAANGHSNWNRPFENKVNRQLGIRDRSQRETIIRSSSNIAGVATPAEWQSAPPPRPQASPRGQGFFGYSLAQHPTRAGKMLISSSRKRLLCRSVLAPWSDSDHSAVDPETIEQLRAIGYDW
jgi:hypothetical protein